MTARAGSLDRGVHGIWGLTYIDLSPLFDTSLLEDIHEEVCVGLARVETSYTGGTLKWMGVVAPPVRSDPYADAMQVIEGFSKSEFARFVSLSDDPSAFDLDRWRDHAFGDETDHPLNGAQLRYLKYRYGVYFPWKVAYHLLENVRWEDKNSGVGKAFSPEARTHFPRTIELVEHLPFREIGRAVIFGLEANDHAPLHRDPEPSDEEVAHCITLCPRRNKRFFLMDPLLMSKIPVDAAMYWFNDMDWHGVEPDPYFRYSLRIDGVFEPSFVRDLKRYVGRRVAGAHP